VSVKVYAFDVDECLEISNGPVTLQSMMDLRIEGHIVGLCGNLTKFCREVPGWQHLISFTMNFDTFKALGGLLPKAVYLSAFKDVNFPDADEYIMVGNVFGATNKLGFVCGSHDSDAAAQAGWRFIKEDDFAAGVR
jgi:hypothetical protein